MKEMDWQVVNETVTDLYLSQSCAVTNQYSRAAVAGEQVNPRTGTSGTC